MRYVTLRDAASVEWQVSECRRTLRATPNARRSREECERWLCFKSPLDKRRLRSYPPNWHALPESSLASLLVGATPTRATRGPPVSRSWVRYLPSAPAFTFLLGVYVRHSAWGPVDDALLLTLRMMCDDARRVGGLVEWLIVFIKEVWDTIPEVHERAGRDPGRRETLDWIITVCIALFFGGSAPTDHRPIDMPPAASEPHAWA